LDLEAFNEIHLLSDHPPAWGAAYVKWLGHKVTLHQVSLKNPTDHAAIFTVVDQALAPLDPAWRKRRADVTFHLSPGTPAMAAIWILLGKTRYPAKFCQTFEGKAWVTAIPFDLAVDYVPQLLRSPDAHLQHLAARSPSEVEGFEHIIGNSPAIRLAVGRAERAAIRQVPVLILGESGTGKELFARAIHNASPRRSGPFVPLNCAAIPKELLESELFGYNKGAFTGASQEYAGAFEQAANGTLFLDEIGECDPAMQTKLLRVLQPPHEADPCTRVFRRLGDKKDRTTNVRVIAATNRPLLDAVKEGQFREDLYYRLAVITVKLPPLRARKADIPLLAERLLRQINTQFQKEEPGYEGKSISGTAMAFMRQRDWPGNVRELHNVLVQAAVMSEGKSLDRADIVAAVAEVPGQAAVDVMEHPLGEGFDLEDHLNNVRKHLLRRAMQEAKGVKTRAAKLLGFKSYQALDAQLKRLGVEPGSSGNWL
jgi:transcriptional regulator with PAS, ATPase and Fis domain